MKYLNNIVEQDHRFIKRRVLSMLGFKFFDTAISIFAGVEAMYMFKKEQLHRQVKSIQNKSFGIKIRPFTSRLLANRTRTSFGNFILFPTTAMFSFVCFVV